MYQYLCLTNRFRGICTIGYCSWDRYVKLSTDTYVSDQYVESNRYNRLLLLEQVCDNVDRYFFDQYVQRLSDRYLSI